MTWRVARAWTSTAPVGGYRHFEWITQGGRGEQRWVELAALLAPSHRERVALRDLRNPSLWLSGWRQLPKTDPEADE